MAIIMIDLGNGTSTPKLDTNNFPACDYICEECTEFDFCMKRVIEEKPEGLEWEVTIG